MKRSAGILVYKLTDNKLKVFLAHMGGPFWENTNEGSWSIPKGEYQKGENARECAVREFEEETGLKIDNSIFFLGSVKVSNNKLVTIFYVEQELDNSQFKSNTFTMEYPKGSGVIQEFTEMDKAEWFDIFEAKKLILPNQIIFLNKLEEHIKRVY